MPNLPPESASKRPSPWLHPAVSLRPSGCRASPHQLIRPQHGIMYVLNILHYQLCYTSGLHHNLTILLSASLSNLQRIRRNFSGEDVTASKALVCRTPQARHAPPTQDDGHPMPPVSPVCHRRPVIAVSTSSSFCARNLAHELEELLHSRPPLTVGLDTGHKALCPVSTGAGSGQAQVVQSEMRSESIATNHRACGLAWKYLLYSYCNIK